MDCESCELAVIQWWYRARLDFPAKSNDHTMILFDFPWLYLVLFDYLMKISIKCYIYHTILNEFNTVKMVLRVKHTKLFYVFIEKRLISVRVMGLVILHFIGEQCIHLAALHGIP